MNDQKWRSPTGHPISSHVTDKIKVDYSYQKDITEIYKYEFKENNDVEAKTMTNDLKTVRESYRDMMDKIDSQYLSTQMIAGLRTLDRMIETPAPQAEDNPTSSEWFFRWIARGKAGYAGMTMERCADMIWHHPDNPYKNDNPWADNDAPTPARLKRWMLKI